MRRLLQAAALAAALVLAPAQAQDGAVRIKAAFLFKFGGFVEWPQEALAPGAPFVIGVLGAEALADELDDVAAGRTVHDRPVAVRRLGSPEAAKGVHVLFVGAAHDARLAAVAAATRGQPVLLVTESQSSTDRGSMINFVVAEDKVRFDVALPPAEAGRLRISARLLSVARRVFRGVS